MFGAVVVQIRAVPFCLHRHPCTPVVQHLVKPLLNTECGVSLYIFVLAAPAARLSELSKLVLKYYKWKQLVVYGTPLGQNGGIAAQQ